MSFPGDHCELEGAKDSLTQFDAALSLEQQSCFARRLSRGGKLFCCGIVVVVVVVAGPITVVYCCLCAAGPNCAHLLAKLQPPSDERLHRAPINERRARRRKRETIVPYGHLSVGVCVTVRRLESVCVTKVAERLSCGAHPRLWAPSARRAGVERALRRRRAGAERAPLRANCAQGARKQCVCVWPAAHCCS